MSPYSCKILAVSLPPSLSHHRPWYWSLFLKYFLKHLIMLFFCWKPFIGFPGPLGGSPKPLTQQAGPSMLQFLSFLLLSSHCFLLISPPRNSQLFLVTSSPVVRYFIPRYCIFILFLYTERPSPFPSPGKRYSCFKTYNRCYIPSFLLNRIKISLLSIPPQDVRWPIANLKLTS